VVSEKRDKHYVVPECQVPRSTLPRYRTSVYCTQVFRLGIEEWGRVRVRMSEKQHMMLQHYDQLVESRR